MKIKQESNKLARLEVNLDRQADDDSIVCLWHSKLDDFVLFNLIYFVATT